MKISYNWLKQFINIDSSAEDTAQILTDLGLEVESISAYDSVKGGLRGVVVGEVLSCEKHPNADRLKVTKVRVSENEVLDIVCGAPNVAAGQKVAVALVGTKLYDQAGVAFELKKNKIRGVESCGMICAEDELGLGHSHDGILVLDASESIGKPCSEVFGVENDYVFEIGLTSNRADAMSHFGVARDLRCALEYRKIKTPINLTDIGDFKFEASTKNIEIDVRSPHLAPRYAGMVLTNVVVRESPKWLQNRLKAIGLAPKNNVVDITNYVLHNLGQPLHAFDADAIFGRKIVVKTAKEGTAFVTLDGVDRKLSSEDLMICDSEKPLCIAGVLGGLHSGITENTSSVFLESAYFDPISIRKTAKRHGINTDASFRFERGIDPNITVYALKCAASMMVQLADAVVSSSITDSYPQKIPNQRVIVDLNNINKLIGLPIPSSTVTSILKSLEIEVLETKGDILTLEVPAYRVDVTREADIIEEILRIYGYNAIPFDDTMSFSLPSPLPLEGYKVEERVANHLAALGFAEIMCNSLNDPRVPLVDTDFEGGTTVKILNALSSDVSAMRSSLINRGLDAVHYNLSRKQSDLKFFEFGKTYQLYKESYREQKKLALFLTGAISQYWKLPARDVDFFYVKGVVSSILARLGLESLKPTPIEGQELFLEGLYYVYDGKILVSFGELSTQVLKHYDIKQPVYYANFYWDFILELASKDFGFKVKEAPKYPYVRRDFSLLLNSDVAFEDIRALSFATDRKILREVSLFDVYNGKNLPIGKKSYGIGFVFQDAHKTLTDEQVDAVMAKLKHTFQEKLFAELR